MNRAVNVETYCQCKKVYGDHTLFPAQQSSEMTLGNESTIGRIYGIFGIRTGFSGRRNLRIPVLFRVI